MKKIVLGCILFCMLIGCAETAKQVRVGTYSTYETSRAIGYTYTTVSWDNDRTIDKLLKTRNIIAVVGVCIADGTIVDTSTRGQFNSWIVDCHGLPELNVYTDVLELAATALFIPENNVVYQAYLVSFCAGAQSGILDKLEELKNERP